MRTFSLSSYTNSTYTDLVRSRDKPLWVKSLLVTNTSTAANFLARIVGYGANGVAFAKAVIQPTVSIEANGSYTLDFGPNGIGIEQGDAIQVQGSAAGLNFYASASEEQS